MHEATEVWAYWSCMQQESNARIKAIWERFLSYELGQLHSVMDLMRKLEGRDPAELLPAVLPEPVKFESQRDFVRKTLAQEVDLRADGVGFVSADQEPRSSLRYREQLNADGSPSELVATRYQFTPGTELDRVAAAAAH